MFFETEPRETLRFEGNKINCSRGTSLKVICYIAHEEKPFRLQIYENKSRKRSTFAGNSALLPCDVIDLQCCPLRDLGGKQFHC